LAPVAGCHGAERRGGAVICLANPEYLAIVDETAVTAVVSYLIAHLFRLPEGYWAPMSTLIPLQSTLSAALPVSAQYVAGTAIGAAVGAAVDAYFPANVWGFGLAAFTIGLLCILLRVERSAYRNASITLAIVMLVPRSSNGRLVALHRFFEVSIGIAVGLLFFGLWSKISLRLSAKASSALSTH
jgi:uncharacterized membrane protein YgaE (UPF0421/DUF939 family)